LDTLAKTRRQGEASRRGAPPQPGGVPLGQFALFAGVPGDELARLERACRYRRFAPEEAIIERDGATSEVFLLLAGRVRLIVYSACGREVAFDELADGAYFGEIAALDGKPRSASVVAIRDTLVAVLPGQVFLDVLDRHPEVAMRVMRKLIEIVRTANERIIELSTLPAHVRVQAELLRRAQARMRTGNEARIEPAPRHSEIGCRIGATRETVARVMSDLARNHLLSRTKGGLVIHDVARLERMVREEQG
jgi:CRP-like cAMP-binding protein